MNKETKKQLQQQIKIKEQELNVLKNRYKLEFGSDDIVVEDCSSVLRILDNSINIGAEDKKEILLSVLSIVGDAYLFHDQSGQILSFDENLPHLLGYSPEELSGMNIADIEDTCHEISNTLLKEGDSDYFSYETKFIKKDKQKIDLDLQIKRLTVDGKSLYLMVMKDITIHSEAIDELKGRTKSFRTLVENSDDVIMRFDRSYRHLFVNAASKKTLGIEPKEFIGKTHEELNFPLHLCEFWDSEMEKVFQSKKTEFIQFSLGEGEDIQYFEWQLIPEFNEDDSVDTLLAVARNITKRRRSELALENEIKTKDKFFSLLAHDLKSPFNVLLPIVSTLNDNIESFDKNDIADMISLINKAVMQEYNLLESLLEWSRLQQGLIKKKDVSLNMRVLAELAVQLNSINAESKNITIKINSEGDLTFIGDKYMINSIIRNLLSNAIKFTHNGGRITIDIKDKQDNIVFRVIDTGIGMSAEMCEKIFDITVNSSRSGTNDEMGTGLGLILCKEFINMHKGSISATSGEGKGTTFTVKLPKQ